MARRVETGSSGISRRSRRGGCTRCDRSARIPSIAAKSPRVRRRVRGRGKESSGRLRCLQRSGFAMAELTVVAAEAEVVQAIICAGRARRHASIRNGGHSHIREAGEDPACRGLRGGRRERSGFGGGSRGGAHEAVGSGRSRQVVGLQALRDPVTVLVSGWGGQLVENQGGEGRTCPCSDEGATEGRSREPWREWSGRKSWSLMRRS